MITDIHVTIYHPMHFERGKNYCVEAASGIGKSSLLHFIGGFRTDYDGSVLLDGHDIRDYSPAQKAQLYRTELAYLFQDLRLFPNLTAYENVEIVNQQTHFRSKESIRAMFEQLGIAEKWDSPARLLSWGQQQRVAFVRSLSQPCSFLLMDEPISHLDDLNAGVMAEMVMKEQSERHFGIIATSLGKTLPINYHQTVLL
jgi:ABC-type lipoprotein export system ATPase subunit